MKQGEATPIMCDNKSATAMTENPVYHNRMDHIAIKHHFIREAVEDGEIQLKYCNTEEQVADVFFQSTSKRQVWVF